MTWLQGARRIAIVAAGLALATVLVALLELGVGLPDASSVYLVAVVISAMAVGTAAALATAFLAVITYDLLFTAPFLTIVITDKSEWLSLLLLSFVGVSVARLVSLQRLRTREARGREREAQDLYAVTRALAARASTAEALGSIALVLQDCIEVDRVWFSLGSDEAAERVVADTGSGRPPTGGTLEQLRRRGGTAEGAWFLIHDPAPAGRDRRVGDIRLRVLIEAGGERLGSLWATRRRSGPQLDPTAGRLLAATADQVGQVIRQDRLASEAAEAAIAHEASSLKSALIRSVSHDLRTPLASIRAAAGTLMDPGLQIAPGEVTTAAAAIDREAERLDRLVANLLDLGRIQGGALETASEAVELGELVGRAVARVITADGKPPDAGRVQVAVAEETWVDADPVLLEQSVLNVIENAILHTPPSTEVRISAEPVDGAASVRLSIEDGGPGVDPAALPGLFERAGRRRPALRVGRADSGLGLTIVRGFVEAMGGRVEARRSELGGLAIDIELAATRLPAELVGAL